MFMGEFCIQVRHILKKLDKIDYLLVDSLRVCLTSKITAESKIYTDYGVLAIDRKFHKPYDIGPISKVPLN